MLWEDRCPSRAHGWACLDRCNGKTRVMDWKLEVVVVPVTDVDRAKSFYADTLGFHLDGDLQPTEPMRVVHMTPPGSACSVVVGPAVWTRTPTWVRRQVPARRHRHRGGSRSAARQGRRGLGGACPGPARWRQVRLRHRSRRQ
jgi:catechol 2,3-dioxygenase-like lactoylglutathione lyase family enzyme